MAGTFTDRERVIEYVIRHPGETVTILEATCGQTAVDNIYAAMFPEMTADEKRAVYRHAKRLLKTTGLTADSASVSAVQALIDATK